MSKNYFDIEKEFFLIDSENMREATTKLYGYSIQDNGIIEEVNRTEENIKGLNGCGVYVYVEKNENEIVIKQDFNASYGLFLYQNGDYFAISNSFQRLVDGIKKKYPLTLNRDYANHMIAMELASLSANETMIKEIALLPRNSIVTINLKIGGVQLDYIDYEEYKYTLNSVEGMQILDDWYTRWTNLFKVIKSKTNNISMALTGGFDSRLTFMLAIQSGINLSEVRVHSLNDNLHTHSEDYEIASEIAKYYDFQLNARNLSSESIAFSLEDIINIVFYNKLTFHKEMYYKYKKFKDKRYLIPGSGGESVRAHWDITPKQMTQQYQNRTNRYPSTIGTELKESTKSVLETAYSMVREKYDIADTTSSEIPFNMHREARCRSHFGTGAVDDYFMNQYYLAPLLDPALRKLQLNDANCNDKNLLMAVMYERYCPKLLEFKFEGGRSLEKSTITYAKNIAEKYPRLELHDENTSFDIVVYDEISSPEYNENDVVENKYPDKYLKRIFDTKAFKNLFCTFFDESIYDYADKHYRTASYYPMRECYPIIAIVKTLLDTAEYDKLQNNNAFGVMKLFDGSPLVNRENENEFVLDRVKNFITARIDLKMHNDGDFEVISISDAKAIDTTPAWQQQGGKGHVIESNKGILDITVRALTDGTIDIRLKGRDVRDADGKRVAYWIDYQKFVCNDVVIFEKTKSAWHDKVLLYQYPIKKDATIHFHIEWLPYLKRNLI